METPETVFDYFAGEIFEQENSEVQDVLLKTAFLPTVSPRVAIELTCIAHADRILASLSQRNYFTDKRSRPQLTYQYHPLFRSFLLTRAQVTLPDKELDTVRQRASSLLLEAGQVEHAVTLLCDRKDWGQLADVIRQHAAELVAQGRHLTLQDWLGRLPTDMVEGDGWLQFWQGMCVLPFIPIQSRAHFEQALTLCKLSGESDGAFQAWSSIVGSFLYGWGDFSSLDKWIDEIDTLLTEYPSFVVRETEDRVVANMLGALAFRQPYNPQISIWAERAWALLHSAADNNRRVLTGFMLLMYHLWLGNITKASAIAEVMRETVRGHTVSPLSEIVQKAIEAYYQWHVADAQACLQAVTEGLSIAEESGVHILDAQLLAEGAYGSLIGGNVQAAQDFLERMSAVLDQNRRSDVAHYHFVSTWAALMDGDLPGATKHAETVVDIETGMPIPWAENHFALAYVRYEQGELEQANAALSKTREVAQQTQSSLLLFMSGLTDAYFAYGEGQEERGLQALDEALSIGSKQGFVATPFWLPDMMTQLCVKALEAEIHVPYVQHLIRARQLAPTDPPVHVRHWPWPLKISVLGDFRLEKDSQPFQFAGKVQQRPLALLKAIIALGGREVVEEQLTDALWPDAEGNVAHQSFATTLHRLRQLLGNEEAIVLQGGQVSLSPSLCWVDTWAFERMLSQAGVATAGGSLAHPAEQSIALIQQALDLYQGAFLRGEAKAAWALLPRERLRQKFLRAISALGQYWEEQLEWRQAIAWYERGLDVDGLAEEFYQRQMICYQSLGRVADAVTVYQRCQRILKAALGVSPSSETEQLYQNLQAE